MTKSRPKRRKPGTCVLGAPLYVRLTLAQHQAVFARARAEQCSSVSEWIRGLVKTALADA